MRASSAFLLCSSSLAPRAAATAAALLSLLLLRRPPLLPQPLPQLARHSALVALLRLCRSLVLAVARSSSSSSSRLCGLRLLSLLWAGCCGLLAVQDVGDSARVLPLGCHESQSLLSELHDSLNSKDAEAGGPAVSGWVERILDGQQEGVVCTQSASFQLTVVLAAAAALAARLTVAGRAGCRS